MMYQYSQLIIQCHFLSFMIAIISISWMINKLNELTLVSLAIFKSRESSYLSIFLTCLFTRNFFSVDVILYRDVNAKIEFQENNQMSVPFVPGVECQLMEAMLKLNVANGTTRFEWEFCMCDDYKLQICCVGKIHWFVHTIGAVI